MLLQLHKFHHLLHLIPSQRLNLLLKARSLWDLWAHGHVYWNTTMIHIYSYLSISINGIRIYRTFSFSVSIYLRNYPSIYPYSHPSSYIFVSIQPYDIYNIFTGKSSSQKSYIIIWKSYHHTYPPVNWDRPCQIGVGRLVFIKNGLFQGPTVNLPGDYHSISAKPRPHISWGERGRLGRAGRWGKQHLEHGIKVYGSHRIHT